MDAGAQAQLLASFQHFAALRHVEDIILAENGDERVVDRRVVYKAGETQMNEVRDALINFVATKLAEEGTEIPYVTEDVLLETVRNTEVNLKADVYRSGQGNLIISLLY